MIFLPFFRSALAAAIVAVAASEDGLAQTSEWVDVAPARLRLLIAERSEDTVRGGVEVELPPGWKTYWRSPGDAGIPPRFDMSGSRNVAGLAVSYPYPERYFDGAFTSLVYEDHVIFPFEATLEDPAARTDLKLTVDLGICEKICIPARAEVALRGVTGEEDVRAAARIEPFARSVPVPASDTFGLDRIERVEGGLVIEASADGRPADDVIVEAPAAWGLPQPERRGRSFWLAVEGGLLDGAAEDAKLRFTIVADGRAVEEIVPLGEIR